MPFDFMRPPGDHITSFRTCSFLVLLWTLPILAQPDRQSTIWDSRFNYQYDYVLHEDAGLERTAEPVEITLSAETGEVRDWRNEILVVRLDPPAEPELIPLQILGHLTAATSSSESVNIVFLAACPANQKATYRLLWDKKDAHPLPAADGPMDLKVEGKPPGMTIQNAHYRVVLAAESGAILNARLARHGSDKAMDFYQKLPIHFGADVWSPPAKWDHDYDWNPPPQQRFDEGPLQVQYHRWGPLKRYRDVNVYLTYTFYAQVPYIKVVSMMEFTENRSARAVRLGEVVVTHAISPDHSRASEISSADHDFTHFAWAEDSEVKRVDIGSKLNADGMAQVEGLAPGSLAVLDRDVPWVAGYHDEKGYGLASLRRAHFTGSKFGNPLPVTASSTILAQYGWGFTYWSRPEVFPFGMLHTKLDQNVIVSKGTTFSSEEALLIFEPTHQLESVSRAYQQFSHPLKLEYRGSGPW